MPTTNELYRENVLGNYAGFDLEIVSGSGSRLFDGEGRGYLDFCTGLAVCSLGHCHPTLTRAIQEQAARLLHISNLYKNRNQAEAARLLNRAVGSPGRIFFSNSGAESNEAVIKLARKFYHATRGETGCVPEVLTFSTSFHGRTLAGIAATGQDKVKTGFGPMPEGFRHLPFNDVAAVRAGIRKETAALLVEPIQGEGGIHVATPEFLRALNDVAREHNLLLLLDEVQSGLGRAGHWCCWKALGADTIAPDAVAWAKGMGGGFPIGAVWISARDLKTIDGTQMPLHELLGPGSHGTTYGGSPLGTAAVAAVLETIENEGLIDKCRVRSEEAFRVLRGFKSRFIREVRGAGLMIGIALDEAALGAALPATHSGKPPSAALSMLLMEKGLLAPPAGPGVLRWLPALNVSADEIQEAFSILKSVLDSLE